MSKAIPRSNQLTVVRIERAECGCDRPSAAAAAVAAAAAQPARGSPAAILATEIR